MDLQGTSNEHPRELQGRPGLVSHVFDESVIEHHQLWVSGTFIKHLFGISWV